MYVKDSREEMTPYPAVRHQEEKIKVEPCECTLGHKNMSRGFYLPNPADGHILSEKMIIMKDSGISS